jgi:DNA-binding CsgD family transcriptional regulator
MGTLRETRNQQKSGRFLERPWITPEMGLILVDKSLKPLAFNREAAAILNYPELPPQEQQTTIRVPEEVLGTIRTGSTSTDSVLVTHFRAGRRQYICQVYELKGCNEFGPEPVLALLLQRNSSPSEAIYEVAAEFNLTEREREALSGISMGLTIKELAKQMDISPHTVKAYLRFIMVKMGVGTRAAIVAKILEHSGSIGKGTSGEALRRVLRARA